MTTTTSNTNVNATTTNTTSTSSDLLENFLFTRTFNNTRLTATSKCSLAIAAVALASCKETSVTKVAEFLVTQMRVTDCVHKTDYTRNKLIAYEDFMQLSPNEVLNNDTYRTICINSTIRRLSRHIRATVKKYDAFKQYCYIDNYQIIITEKCIKSCQKAEKHLSAMLKKVKASVTITNETAEKIARSSANKKPAKKAVKTVVRKKAAEKKAVKTVVRKKAADKK